MNKVKEMFLNSLLVMLLISMLFLVGLNFSYNLNPSKIPETNVLYGIITTIFNTEQINTSQGSTYKGEPSKLYIKNSDDTHGILYDRSEISPIFNEVYDELFDAFLDFDMQIVSNSSFETAFYRENILYLEFMMPLSGIFDVDNDLFVSSMVIDLDTSEIFIKSELDYLKINGRLDFPDIFVSLYKNEYKFSFELTDLRNTYDLVSFNPLPVKLIETKEHILTNEQKLNIISEFLYNPNIIEEFETTEDSVSTYVYANEFSTITMNENFLEFSSRDTRGDIFSENRNTSKNEKIAFATSIFNNIQGYLGSELLAFPSNVYQSDGNTYVILGAKINGIEYYYEDYAGYFVFSSSGVNFAEINMDLVNVVEREVLLEPSAFIITTSPENASLSAMYRDDKPRWVFKVN